MLALTVPLRTRDDSDRADRASPLHRLEHGLHPWVAFLIIPIFGFANAGVSFAGMNLQTLMQPVPLGIAAGSFVGKQTGVFGFAWLPITSGHAPLPGQPSWRPRHRSDRRRYGKEW